MFPGGRVGIESSYLPSKPELFTIRSHCFDTVKIPSACFKKNKVQHTQTVTLNLPSSLSMHAIWALGRGQIVQKKAQMDQYYFQNQYLKEGLECVSYWNSTQRSSFLVQGLIKEQQSYKQPSYPSPFILQLRKLKLSDVHPISNK